MPLAATQLHLDYPKILSYLLKSGEVNNRTRRVGCIYVDEPLAGFGTTRELLGD
jgi:hypothetical protein